ncbi:hypothetical protein GCM10011573_23400 [Enterococcus wangshanyuanii]|uniref:Uncharacterized protein n=1 Tax=Enterococcus wangshanyuanii TaxID=2005703 RepID=A0ABQ1P982_9ENTE|nr:hypothetical protein GCM10011573_23400 [Enterococcus wangshanyuanii]
MVSSFLEADLFSIKMILSKNVHKIVVISLVSIIIDKGYYDYYVKREVSLNEK